MTEAVQFLSDVEQIMRTAVPAAYADQPISAVKKIARDNDGDPVPVIESDHTLRGVINADSLIFDGPSTAGQLASHPRMTVAPHESAFSVARRMISRRVDWVPVVKDRKLVGTVTRSCILSAFGELNRV